MGSNSRLAAPQGVSAQPPASSSPLESLASGGFNPASAPQTMNISSGPSGQPPPWASGGPMPGFDSLPQNFKPAVLNAPTMGAPQTGGPMPMPQTAPTDGSHLANFDINELPGPGAFGPQNAAATGFTQKCPTCGK